MTIIYILSTLLEEYYSRPILLYYQRFYQEYDQRQAIEVDCLSILLH